MKRLRSKKNGMTIDDLALMIQLNVAMKEDLKGFFTKEDLKSFATKEDLKGLESRMDERFNEMATKTDVFELERKLLEDTGSITGVERKHYKSLTQRVSRLEHKVFDKRVAT